MISMTMLNDVQDYIGSCLWFGVSDGAVGVKKVGKH